MRRRLAQARVGRLATADARGRPHVVPCCFALDETPSGDRLYSVVDAKPKSTWALRRLANLTENPAAALLVDRYEEDWSALWWVRVDGQGRVVTSGPERDRAVHQLAVKYEQYRRTPPPGPAIVVDVTGWRAWP